MATPVMKNAPAMSITLGSSAISEAIPITTAIVPGPLMPGMAIGKKGTEEHLVADDPDDKTTGNTKRSIRDAEEDEKQVSGSQTYQHDGCSVIAGPVSLLFTHV